MNPHLDFILAAEFVELLLGIDLDLFFYEGLLSIGLTHSHLHKELQRKQIC